MPICHYARYVYNDMRHIDLSRPVYILLFTLKFKKETLSAITTKELFILHSDYKAFPTNMIKHMYM